MPHFHVRQSSIVVGSKLYYCDKIRNLHCENFIYYIKEHPHNQRPILIYFQGSKRSVDSEEQVSVLGSTDPALLIRPILLIVQVPVPVGIQLDSPIICKKDWLRSSIAIIIATTHPQSLPKDPGHHHIPRATISFLRACASLPECYAQRSAMLGKLVMTSWSLEVHIAVSPFS